jgi:mannosyltransferase
VDRAEGTDGVGAMQTEQREHERREPTSRAREPNDPATRLDRSIVVGAMAAVAALGSYALGRPSLWVDEGSSFALATMPWSQFVTHTVETEASGSVYYLLLRVWIAFGQEEWWLRLPSVLMAVAAIPVTFLLVRELLGRRTARLAAVLLAGNAMLLEWAREARGYSLALLLSAVMGYALVRALRDGDPRWWGIWVLASVLNVSAHLVSLFVIAAQVLVLPLLPMTGTQRRLAVVAVGATGLLSSPLIWFGLTSGEQIQWIDALARWQVEGFAREITGASMNRYVLPAMLLVLVGAVVVLRGPIRWPVPWERFGGYLLVAWAGVPVLLLLVVSLVQPMFVPRYLIGILPAFVALLAVGLERFSRWPVVEGGLAVVVLGLGWTTITGLYDDAGKQDFRRIVAIVDAEWEQGDALARQAGTGLGTHEYYVARSDLGDRLPVRMYGGIGPQSYRGNPAILDFELTTPASSIAAERLWLEIHPDEFETDIDGALRKHGLSPGWQVIRAWPVEERVLLLLEHGPTPS